MRPAIQLSKKPAFCWLLPGLSWVLRAQNKIAWFLFSVSANSNGPSRSGKASSLWTRASCLHLLVTTVDVCCVVLKADFENENRPKSQFRPSAHVWTIRSSQDDFRLVAYDSEAGWGSATYLNFLRTPVDRPCSNSTELAERPKPILNVSGLTFHALSRRVRKNDA